MYFLLLNKDFSRIIMFNKTKWCLPYIKMHLVFMKYLIDLTISAPFTYYGYFNDISSLF